MGYGENMGIAPATEVVNREEGGWIVDHDDRPSFFLPYLALSVICSVFVSLFWLVALVGTHLAIELRRARRLQVEQPFGRALWEIKLDTALLILALTMAVYMDVAFGILGLGASARAGSAAARVGARAEQLRKLFRGLLLVLDDIVRVVGVVAATRGISKEPPPLATSLPPWRARWGWGDRISLSLLGVASLLLLLSPWLSGHSPGAILQLMLAELHPWPGAQG